MRINLDALKRSNPDLYRAMVNEPGFTDGTEEYSDHIKSQLIAWAESQSALNQPDQLEPPAPPEMLREWQLPLDATESQIRTASFLVRKDLARRQHEAAVREK